MGGRRSFKFSWGPPNLARALETRDPRHVTRAPRRRCAKSGGAAQAALQAPGAECVIFRRLNTDLDVHESWYMLKEPIKAECMVGRTTFDGVTLRYDHRGAQQSAQFCVPASKVPEIQRMTRIVKVTETLGPSDAADREFESGGCAYTTKKVHTVPEAAYEAMLRGVNVPEDVVAQLNQITAARGLKCEEAETMWEAVEGDVSVCLRII